MFRLLCFLIIIFCAQLVYAQQSENPDYTKFVLDAVDFEIDGLTNEKALIRKIDLEVGREFETFVDLKDYAELMRQRMINLRVFSDVSHKIEPLDHSVNVKKYRIIWKIKDSWTLFAIPYPKYDSNTGLLLGLQVFYGNAFGTMTNWFLGLNYDFGNGEYAIRPRVSGIKIGTLSFSVSLSQSHQVERKLHGANVLAHWEYDQTNWSIGTSVPIYDLLSYDFSPGFNFRYNYSDVAGKKGFNEDLFDFSFSQGLSYGKLDWENNFRNGFNVSLDNNLSAVNREEQFRLTSTIGLNGNYYKTWGILNLYSRAGINFGFDQQILSYGRYIRGVVDDDMHGDWGTHFNTSLGIQFWRWEGVWDAQMHPFVDIGLTGENDSSINWEKNLKVGAGIDFVLYLDALKNLVARGTIGFDLTSTKPLLESYEIIITSSLHY